MVAAAGDGIADGRIRFVAALVVMLRTRYVICGGSERRERLARAIQWSGCPESKIGSGRIMGGTIWGLCIGPISPRCMSSVEYYPNPLKYRGGTVCVLLVPAKETQHWSRYD